MVVSSQTSLSGSESITLIFLLYFRTAHCIKNPAFILKAAPPHSRLASILAQLAWCSGEPNGGRADQFGATAVDRDYAATLIAASVRNCGLRHRRSSRLTGSLSALTRYRRAASIAPGFLQTSLSLCSLAPFFPLSLSFFFFCADAGFCKYWRNMAAVRGADQWAVHIFKSCVSECEQRGRLCVRQVMRRVKCDLWLVIFIFIIFISSSLNKL